jgi:hypothetical protein
MSPTRCLPFVWRIIFILILHPAAIDARIFVAKAVFTSGPNPIGHKFGSGESGVRQYIKWPRTESLQLFVERGCNPRVMPGPWTVDAIPCDWPVRPKQKHGRTEASLQPRVEVCVLDVWFIGLFHAQIQSVNHSP